MVTVNYQVGASTDDAANIGLFEVYDDDDSFYSLVGIALPNPTMGVRFTGVAVPQGATITSASFDFYGSKTGSGDVDVDVAGVDEDDLATWASLSNEPASATKTTARSDIQFDFFAFPTPQWFTGWDCTDIVQEIVDRGGWATGNDMGLLFFNGSATGRSTGLVTYTYDQSSSLGVKLHITYTVSGTSSINISDSWKGIDGMQININDTWKTVVGMQINKDDSWKTVTI